jgi:uncharacterized protein YbjT (DUF2867 family)
MPVLVANTKIVVVAGATGQTGRRVLERFASDYRGRSQRREGEQEVVRIVEAP